MEERGGRKGGWRRGEGGRERGSDLVSRAEDDWRRVDLAAEAAVL
jgi:hypothetical protein